MRGASAEAVDPDPRAWTRAGVQEVAAGVWRIPLPLPLEGLGAVNAYVLQDGGDVVLVDPGWAGEDTWRALSAAMAELGLAPADVGRIVSTHTHWDHYSQAMAWRERFGTPVAIGAGERPTVEAYRADEGFFPVQVQRLRVAGAPDLARVVEALPLEDHERDLPFGAPSSWLADGEVLALGERSLVAVATPGHTRGSVVLDDAGRGLMVTGDHVLPRITPSTGLELAPEAFPLRSFLASLARLRALPDRVMLPAHGAVSPSVHTRVEELLAHHEERFAAVEDALRHGGRTAADVGARLRWTKRDLVLDDLAPVHRMVAVLEVAAHLDVLEQRGRVRREVVDGVAAFEVTASEVSASADGEGHEAPVQHVAGGTGGVLGGDL